MATLFSLIFAVVWLTLVIDAVPLGPNFLLAIVVSSIDAVITAFGIIPFLILASSQDEKPSPSPSNRSTFRKRMVIVCYVFVVIAAAGGTLFGLKVWNDMQVSKTVADAESARREFLVLNHKPDFDQARVTQTLAEFEQARRTLRDLGAMDESEQLVRLWLFRDLNEYRAQLGEEWSSGGVYCSSGGASVYIPLERTFNTLSESDRTYTPVHEMVHAAMCQSLGKNAFYSVHRWFHEGLAQLYENEPYSMGNKRTMSRLRAWAAQDDLPDPEFFCGEPPRSSPSEVRMFYLAAFEFARALEARNGRTAFIEVVDDVKSGISFKNSVRERLGGSCYELYGEWMESW